MDSEALIAENSQQDSHQSGQHSSENPTHSASDAHAAAPQEEVGVFKKLIGDLGDHHGLVLGPYHVADLPIILYDDGLHFYLTEKSMNEAGVFATHVDAEGHKHYVSTATGKSPTLDLSVTNFVFFEWLAMLIMFVVALKAAKRYKQKNDQRA